jgi:post-segregation antitoxin (ccd killing protein)
MGKAELQIDADLLKRAMEAGLSPVALAEDALRSALQALRREDADARAAKWAADNAAAIEEYNRRIDERGVFSDGARTW